MTAAGLLSKVMRPLPGVTAAWSRVHARLLVKSGGRFMPKWFGRGERRQVRPRVVEGEERAKLWREFAASYPALDEYTTMTTRRFPVVVLERHA